MLPKRLSLTKKNLEFLEKKKVYYFHNVAHLNEKELDQVFKKAGIVFMKRQKLILNIMKKKKDILKHLECFFSEKVSLNLFSLGFYSIETFFYYLKTLPKTDIKKWLNINLKIFGKTVSGDSFIDGLKKKYVVACHNKNLFLTQKIWDQFNFLSLAEKKILIQNNILQPYEVYNPIFTSFELKKKLKDMGISSQKTLDNYANAIQTYLISELFIDKESAKETFIYSKAKELIKRGLIVNFEPELFYVPKMGKPSAVAPFQAFFKFEIQPLILCVSSKVFISLTAIIDELCSLCIAWVENHSKLVGEDTRISVQCIFLVIKQPKKQKKKYSSVMESFKKEFSSSILEEENENMAIIEDNSLLKSKLNASRSIGENFTIRFETVSSFPVRLCDIKLLAEELTSSLDNVSFIRYDELIALVNVTWKFVSIKNKEPAAFYQENSEIINFVEKNGYFQENKISLKSNSRLTTAKPAVIVNKPFDFENYKP